MRFFNYLKQSDTERVFYLPPCEFDFGTNKNDLSYSLGATLYAPATNKKIAENIIGNKFPGLTSLVLCTEDSIDDSDIDNAKSNLLYTFEKLNDAVQTKHIKTSYIPMIFIRVRDIEFFEVFNKDLIKSPYLCGFVFPKITSDNLARYFDILNTINSSSNIKLYGMPILESPQIIYKESRVSELAKIKNILKKYNSSLLNVRIGSTDFSSLYSLRRNKHQTIYDLYVINDCINDIVNIFLRTDDDSNFVVAGSVWEYFSDSSDTFIKEIVLDRANGLNGKSIIHPSQIPIVNALQTVTKEDYSDALNIVESSKRGVQRSHYRNKMNEPKPHIHWAKKILTRSKIYGVLNEEFDYKDLLKLS